MSRQTRFRPYVALPSDRERLHRLQDFFQWIYQVYSSRDQFSYDFYKVLGGLNMGGGVDWGSDKLTTYVEGKDLNWCQELQRQVRDEGEKNFDALSTNLSFNLPFYPRYLVFQGSPGGNFIGFGHRPGGEPTLEKIKAMILLRLADVLLYRFNVEALVRCAECHHYTVRSHPRGKTYCSPVCRVRAAVKTRQQTLQAATTRKRQKPKRKEG